MIKKMYDHFGKYRIINYHLLHQNTTRKNIKEIKAGNSHFKKKSKDKEFQRSKQSEPN